MSKKDLVEDRIRILEKNLDEIEKKVIFKIMKEIYELSKKIIDYRKKPLLVLFYPTVSASMEEDDIYALQKEFELNNLYLLSFGKLIL